MSDLKTSFYNRVSEVFQPKSFYFLTDQIYARNVSQEFQEQFSLGLFEFNPGYGVCPGVGVRHEIVESIFHRTSGWDAKSRDFTCTMGTTVTILKEGNTRFPGAYQIPLRQPADIESAVAESMWAYKEHAIPYFERFRSLREIDTLLNEHPEKQCFDRYVPWLRWSTGIIVAKLINRSNYAQLAERYADFARFANNGFYWSRFEALLKDLKENVQPLSDPS